MSSANVPSSTASRASLPYWRTHPGTTKRKALFAEAITTAKRQRSRAWELRATTSLARLYLRTGRRQEGHATLSGIYSQFTEGFDRPDLVAARALLDELAA